VAELPRSALVARFGDEGALLHARARGEETERFRPRSAPERMALGISLEPPAEGLEAIRFVLRRLAAALAEQLAARGRAAGLARLVVTHDLAFARHGTPPESRLEQRLPEPTADAEVIERLLLARLEQAPPPAAVARLELELASGAGARPAASTAHAAGCEGCTPGWRLARLAIAFGADWCGGWSWSTPRHRSPRPAGGGSRSPGRPWWAGIASCGHDPAVAGASAHRRGAG
jgi:hypothetical protein